MKKVLILLTAVVSLYACNSSDKAKEHDTKTHVTPLTEEEKNQVLADSANFTTIEWPDSTFRDFGKVKEGEVLEVSFRFKNTGDKNLIISDVRPGCGCTDGQKPEEPIAPGEEGVIKAKFNSKGQHIGENRKNITVTANTKPSQITELSFKAEVTN